jgi:hypothetical protein
MMNRKQFLWSVAGLAGGSVLAACNGDNQRRLVDAPPAPIDAPECTTASRCVNVDAEVDAGTPVSCSSTGAVVGDNHGHAVVVSDADITAGVEKTYDIRGTSGHAHAITITAALFAKLRTHMAITVPSTEVGGHTHDVTVTCAA